VKRVGDLVERERALVHELRQVRVSQAGQAAAEAVAAGRALPPGPDGAARTFVSRIFDGFGDEALKAFVDAALASPGRVVTAVDRSAAGFRWTVAHSLGADLDLAAVVKPVIAAHGLRGGGRSTLVQGAGADPSGALSFVEAVERALRE
jgi:alanyl-tRNA synthetase